MWDVCSKVCTVEKYVIWNIFTIVLVSRLHTRFFWNDKNAFLDRRHCYCSLNLPKNNKNEWKEIKKSTVSCERPFNGTWKKFMEIYVFTSLRICLNYVQQKLLCNERLNCLFSIYLLTHREWIKKNNNHSSFNFYQSIFLIFSLRFTS